MIEWVARVAGWICVLGLHWVLRRRLERRHRDTLATMRAESLAREAHFQALLDEHHTRVVQTPSGLAIARPISWRGPAINSRGGRS